MKLPTDEELNRLDGDHTIEVPRVHQWSKLMDAVKRGRIGSHIRVVLNPRLGDECRIVGGRP
jgi:hypothetical protein